METPFLTSILVEFTGHKMENPNIIVMTKHIPDSWSACPRTPWYQFS